MSTSVRPWSLAKAISTSLGSQSSAMIVPTVAGLLRFCFFGFDPPAEEAGDACDAPLSEGEQWVAGSGWQSSSIAPGMLGALLGALLGASLPHRLFAATRAR